MFILINDEDLTHWSVVKSSQSSTEIKNIIYLRFKVETFVN